MVIGGFGNPIIFINIVFFFFYIAAAGKNAEYESKLMRIEADAKILKLQVGFLFEMVNLIAPA